MLNSTHPRGFLLKNTSRAKVTASLIGLALLISGCSNIGGSTEAIINNASVGGKCDRVDDMAHIDSLNIDVKCVEDTNGNLTWTEVASSGAAAGDAGMGEIGLKSSDEIPAIMQNVGFDMKAFDPATGMAGAMKITGTRPPKAPTNDPNAKELDARNTYLFLPFGYTEADGDDPQWSFYLPLGTPVISLIDGTVCDVPKLYSDDFSIRVVPDGYKCESAGRASIMFETEHVIDPLVKVGDRVMAGQKIATVSDYTKSWKELGYGIVEIGVFFALENDLTPWHACPTRFFDPKVKAGLVSDLKSVADAWSKEIGMPDMYKQATNPEFGCIKGDVHN